MDFELRIGRTHFQEKNSTLSVSDTGYRSSICVVQCGHNQTAQSAGEANQTLAKFHQDRRQGSKARKLLQLLAKLIANLGGTGCGLLGTGKSLSFVNYSI